MKTRRTIERLRKPGSEDRERDRLKGRETVSYLTGTLMDKSNDWPSVLKSTGAREAIARRQLPKLT